MAKSSTPPVPVSSADTAASFSALIARLEDGALDRDLSAGMRDLIIRLARRYRTEGGKLAGKITLVIDFPVIDGMVHTKPSFKIEPAPSRPADRFYPTPEGALTQVPIAVQDDLDLLQKGKG